jgi:hypothetical protein
MGFPWDKFTRKTSRTGVAFGDYDNLGADCSWNLRYRVLYLEILGIVFRAT